MRWLTGGRRVERLETQLGLLQERLERQSDEIAALRAELAEGVTKYRELDLEWMDAYEKFRSLYGRISKRMERASQPKEDDEPETPTNGLNPLAARLLSQGGVRE